MIPYDDLVVALTAWRARQGLPVAQPVAVTPPAPAPPAPARPAAAPARPAAAPARPVPQTPPPPPPDAGDFEEGGLVEDAGYDVGEDYVMQLGGEQPGEATEIGSVPEPTAPAPRRGKRPDGW